jgi:hypothetical protein
MGEDVAQAFPLNHRPRPRFAAADAALRELPDDWTVLRERTIGGVPAHFVLVHAEIGVLVANLDGGSSAACEAIHAMLVRERFTDYYPEPLRLMPVDIPSAEGAAAVDVIEAALRETAPIDHDPSWRDDLIELLLTPEDLSMACVRAPAPLSGSPAVCPPASQPGRRSSLLAGSVRFPASRWPYAVAAGVMAAVLVAERVLPGTTAVDISPVVTPVVEARAASFDLVPIDDSLEGRAHSWDARLDLAPLDVELVEPEREVAGLPRVVGREAVENREAPVAIVPAFYMQPPPQFPVLVGIRPLPVPRRRTLPRRHVPAQAPAAIDCAGRWGPRPMICLYTTPLRSRSDSSGRSLGGRIRVGGIEPQ